MKQVFDIKQLLRGKVKNFLMLCFVLLLCACGDEEHGSSCPTVQEVGTACPLCMFFDILSESAALMANTAWDRLAKPLSIIVLIAASIQIAAFTLRLVSSLGKQTVADYLTSEKNGIFILMFKTAVIFGLLQTHEFREYIIAPLLEAAMQIGTELSIMGGNVYTAGGSSWDAIFGLMKDAAKNFNKSVHFVVGLGEAMACDASKEGMKFWLWDYLQLLYGSMLFVFGWMLLAGVTFYMVDLTIRLAFAAVLLPFGIACACSNLSMPYAKNVWNLFVNVFFSLIMLGIIVGIIILIVLHCVGGGDAPALGAFVYDLTEAIDGNKVSEMSAAMVSFGHLILTIVCFSIVLQLVEQMGVLASDISDTAAAGDISPAQQAGAAVQKMAVDNAKKAGKWAGQTTLGAVQQVGHDIARATRLDKLYRWSGRKADVARGFLTGTGAQGYNAFWRKQTRRKIGRELSGFASDSRVDRIRRLWRWIK